MNLHNLSRPGEKKEIMIPVPKADGIPAFFVRGINQGKLLVVTAGVHGCEYVGIQAVRELIQEICTQELSGSILFIPLVNAEGFYEGAKQIVPEDGENLNRCFPGSEKGSISSRMAYTLEEFLVDSADFLLDLHGGDVNESMTPLVFFPVGAGEEIERKTRAATDFLSVDYRVQSRADNGLYSYAAQCKVPALLVERGGGGTWDTGEVLACKRNVYEILDYLGIRPMEEKAVPPREIAEVRYEEAGTRGFWYCYKTPGSVVKEGEVLGELTDVYGNTIKRYQAEYDGVILYLTHALGVKPGDPLIAYGRGSAGISREKSAIYR